MQLVKGVSVTRLGNFWKFLAKTDVASFGATFGKLGLLFIPTFGYGEYSLNENIFGQFAVVGTAYLHHDKINHYKLVGSNPCYRYH